MGKENGKKCRILKLVTCMRENTSLIRRMGKECFSGNQAIFSRVLIKMMRGKDMGRCTGLMDQHIKENGSKEFSMG